MVTTKVIDCHTIKF